jgi:hypothetical protein
MKINLLAFLLFSTTCTCVLAQTQFTTIGNAPRSEKKLGFFNPLTGTGTNQATMRRYATNANRPGIVQIGLGWGSVIGGATLTEKTIDTVASQIGLGITSNFGLRVQYGISEPVSLGFYVRKDIGAYVTKDLGDFDLSGLSFGFEGKAYLINKDMFAVYLAPTIGSSIARSNIDTVGGTAPGRAVGLNYGITAGLNWYWTDGFGMSCDLGYKSSSLIGIFDDPELADIDYKIKYGGLYFGVGLVVKFDTRKY